MYPHFEIIIPAYALFTCIGLFFMMLAIYYRSKKLQISFESFLLLMGILAAGAVLGMHIPQELRIRSRGTERHSASN